MNGKARHYEPLPSTHQRNCRERKSKIDNGKANQRGTHRREAKQGTMNRAHQPTNGTAMGGTKKTHNNVKKKDVFIQKKRALANKALRLFFFFYSFIYFIGGISV